MDIVYITALAMTFIHFIKQGIETLVEEKTRIEHNQSPLPTSAYVLLAVRYLVRLIGYISLWWVDPFTLPNLPLPLFINVAITVFIVELIAFLVEVLVRVIASSINHRRTQKRLKDVYQNTTFDEE